MDSLTVKGVAASLPADKCARDAGTGLAEDHMTTRAWPLFDSQGIEAPSPRNGSTLRTLLLAALALMIGAGAVPAAERLGLIKQQVVSAQPAPPSLPAPIGVGALGYVEPASWIRRLGPPSTLAITRVQRLFVHEGERVKAGELLAEFADADLKDAAAAQAIARVAEAQAALALVKAAGRPSEVAAQQARIDSLMAAQQITAQDAARSAVLVPSGAATRVQADRDHAAAQQAAANLQQAMAQLITLERPRPEDVSLAEARLQTAKATLANARADATLSRVYAPVNGEILKIYAHSGDSVGPDGLLAIADLNNLDVVADVYQTDLSRVRLGAHAEVIVPGDSHRYAAKVVQIGDLVAHTTQAGTDPVARVDGRTAQVRLALLPAGVNALQGRIDMQVQVAIQP